MLMEYESIGVFFVVFFFVIKRNFFKFNIVGFLVLYIWNIFFGYLYIYYCVKDKFCLVFICLWVLVFRRCKMLWSVYDI